MSPWRAAIEGSRQAPDRGTRAAGACPVCAGVALRAFEAFDRNRLMSDQRFSYACCSSCGSFFLETVPPDLSRYYEESYYQLDEHGQPAWRGEPNRIAAARARVELVQRHVPDGHLIELGSGTGAFAVTARDAGFSVSAFEMSEACCRYLDSEERISAICSDDPLGALEGMPQAQAVVMWHVLEHLEDPAAVIEAAARKLTPGGVLALAVPNPESLQFRTLRARWMHLDAPRHLRLIGPETLVSLGQRSGLRLLEMTTTDPDGLECNLAGWITALTKAPALQSGRAVHAHVGGLICKLAAPLERRGLRGSAVTVLMDS